jgi:hypothetical protein
MNVYEKLLDVQAQLKAPKSQYNSFGKYSYRNCEDILEAVKPICKKVKACVWLSDTLEKVGDRYYIKATATFVDVESGEKLTAEAYAREEETKKGMDGSQVTGASSSYARKYALNGLFDIDDTKDSDTTNTHGKEKPEEAPKPEETPKEQKPKEKTPRERLIAKLKEMGINATDYAKEKGLSGKVPDSRFEELLKELG